MERGVNYDQQTNNNQQPNGYQQPYGYPPMNNMNVNANVNVQNNFISKVALVLSILSFICCCIDWLFSIPAIICAIIALIKNKKDAAAWAAVVISSLSLGFYVLAMLSGLMEDLTNNVTEKTNTVDTSIIETEIEDSIKTSESDIKTSENEHIIVENSQKTESNEQVSYNITDTQFYTFTNSIGEMEYLFIMEVENNGDCDIYLKNCVMNLEDNDGHLLQAGDSASSCPNVIKPGEKGYFYNGLISLLLDDGIDTSNGINCVPDYEIVKATKEAITYEVSDLSLLEDMGAAKIVGRLTNTTSKDDSGVYVNVIFYDNTGKVIGITGTNVYDVKSGETKSFDCSAMFMAGDTSYSDIADYEVIAQKDYYQW